jgi:hypothetical protein
MLFGMNRMIHTAGISESMSKKVYIQFDFKVHFDQGINSWHSSLVVNQAKWKSSHIKPTHKEANMMKDRKPS